MRLAFAFCLLGSMVMAQEEGTENAPSSAPRPEERPVELSSPEPADEGGSEQIAEPEPEIEAEPETDAGPPERLRLALPRVELEACLARLDALGVTWERAEPITDEASADCGIENPLTVSEILPGLALEPPATLRCETAEALALWSHVIVRPAAGRLSERGALTAIRQGTGYYCRPRADGALSEHSFGNAVDIMAFVFADGPPIAVEPRERDGTMAEAFQDAVRAGACLWFTTVLGPGTDEDHADHLHLDIKARTGGFRLCQ